MRILLMIALLMAKASFAADFSFQSITRDGEKWGILELSGPIVAGDYNEYVSTYNWVRDRVDVVVGIRLSSEGGLVEEAMKIGRHVRQKRLITSVLNTECYSSCALIFLSGLIRNNQGKVGVHRTYFKKGANLSFEELEQSLDKSHSKVVDFLREMRTPEKIIDDFLATSSVAIKILDEIPQDRLYEEYLLSKCGEKPTRPRYQRLPKNASSEQIARILDTDKQIDAKFNAALKAHNECRVPVDRQMQKEAQGR